MRFVSHKITIMNVQKPQQHNLNDELQWIASSLGLFNLRDKNRSCFRIFLALLKSAKQKQPLSSDQIAQSLQLSRGTVVHHIHTLIDSGIVIHDGNKYLLRVDSLSGLVEEIEKDVARTMMDISEVAKKIDRRLS